MPVWAPAVETALEQAASLLRSNATILEVGYNTGMMSCYMASRYAWNIVGYDISESARIKAVENAEVYGVQEVTDFRICSPTDTLYIKGLFDAVFLKSVLYHISDKHLYRKWLNWLHGIVKEGGVVIAVENGKGGMIDRIYRRDIKKARYSDFLLFDKWVEKEFKKKFSNVEVRYFGRYSQFFTYLPRLCRIIRAVEERCCPPDADRCFVASIVAKK